MQKEYETADFGYSAFKIQRKNTLLADAGFGPPNLE